MIIKSIRKQETHRHNHRNGDRSFYQSAIWTKTRNAFIAANPKCVICGAPSQVVDHIKRVADGGDKLNWSNLQAMCQKCHNRKDNNAGR